VLDGTTGQAQVYDQGAGQDQPIRLPAWWRLPPVAASRPTARSPRSIRPAAGRARYPHQPQ